MQQDLAKLAFVQAVERSIIERRLAWHEAHLDYTFDQIADGQLKPERGLGLHLQVVDTIAKGRHGRWMRDRGWRLLVEAGFA